VCVSFFCSFAVGNVVVSIDINFVAKCDTHLNRHFIGCCCCYFFPHRCENIMTCPMKEIGSGSEHCPYDWLAVYDGRDEHAPPIGKFCGMGKFPFSIIGE
jgi:hypothetical protein